MTSKQIGRYWGFEPRGYVELEKIHNNNNFKITVEQEKDGRVRITVEKRKR